MPQSNEPGRKTKTQISFAVTGKLISTFVFATRIVQYIYFLYTKFQASSHILCGFTDWFVWDLVGNPEDPFSQNEAQMMQLIPGTKREEEPLSTKTDKKKFLDFYEIHAKISQLCLLIFCFAVENMTTANVNNFKEIDNKMNDGNKNRTIAATNMNATSR